MKATELIGKKAIRKYHVRFAHGTICRSFMEEPIRIIKATDTHIVYEWCDSFLRICPGANDRPHILSYEYCDDNWLDYNDLVPGQEPMVKNHPAQLSFIQRLAKKIKRFFASHQERQTTAV